MSSCHCQLALVSLNYGLLPAVYDRVQGYTMPTSVAIVVSPLAYQNLWVCSYDFHTYRTSWEEPASHMKSTRPTSCPLHNITWLEVGLGYVRLDTKQHVHPHSECHADQKPSAKHFDSLVGVLSLDDFLVWRFETLVTFFKLCGHLAATWNDFLRNCFRQER